MTGDGSGCREHVGENVVATRVDDDLLSWVEQEAADADMKLAQFLRRVLVVHRASVNGEFTVASELRIGRGCSDSVAGEQHTQK